MMRPSPSIAPIRSPSPSKAMPKSRFSRATSFLQIFQIFRLGRVGMMVGKGAVDLGIEAMMLAGQFGDQLFQRRAGRAIARVPAHAERRELLGAARDAIDIGIQHRLLPRGAGFARIVPVAGLGHLAQLHDVRAEERPALEHHLEAVVIGRIVAAGNHDAAVDIVHAGFGIIEHRRRAEADLHHIAAGGGEALYQRRLQHRRAFAAVIADRHRLAARAPDQRAEAAPDRVRILCPQRFAENPADVIFAQGRGVKLVGHRVLVLRSGNAA